MTIIFKSVPLKDIKVLTVIEGNSFNCYIYYYLHNEPTLYMAEVNYDDFAEWTGVFSADFKMVKQYAAQFVADIQNHEVCEHYQDVLNDLKEENNQ